MPLSNELVPIRKGSIYRTKRGKCLVKIIYKTKYDLCYVRCSGRNYELVPGANRHTMGVERFNETHDLVFLQL